jgi:hypothetical protein
MVVTQEHAIQILVGLQSRVNVGPYSKETKLVLEHNLEIVAVSMDTVAKEMIIARVRTAILGLVHNELVEWIWATPFSQAPNLLG